MATSPRSQFVELDLDKPRQFRFTIFDARDACRYLGNIPGKGSFDSLKLIMALAARDIDAWAAVLSEGLKHEEDGLRPDRALRYLADYLAKGGDWTILAKAVRTAGELGGVWDKVDDGDQDAASTRPTTDFKPST